MGLCMSVCLFDLLLSVNRVDLYVGILHSMYNIYYDAQ